MSYHSNGHADSQYCFPREAVLRLQPRAAGPLIKELITTSGPYQSIPYSYNRGLLVIDPRFDRLPVVGPGWESKTI